ncbi:hypothetical protein RA955_18125 [Geobacillus proteiniphilus]|uniref:RCC1-like domain-containing protein n=1 Tax=Geobacillus proteiniphilus TaxID=860353 RepID=A0ABY9MEV8_9BACL|nr:hypothetical protein [Geobacillus proteiniphilus]WMJ16495.1 hypothetical protein RA955_18125 [Geobacillus proteiniphilus]
MPKLKGLLLVSLLSAGLLFTPYNEHSAEAKVYWDGVELKSGQIGRLTILKQTPLYKLDANKKVFVRNLEPGQKFRIYAFKPDMLGIGGGYYVDRDSRIKYETPSKQKLLERDIDVHNNAYQTVAMSWGYTIAIKQDGTVWQWGQYGTDVQPIKTSTEPVQVKGVENALSVAVNPIDGYSLALLKDGTLKAWGKFSYYYNDREMTANSTKPMKIPDIKGVINLKSDSIGALMYFSNQEAKVFKNEYGTSFPFSLGRFHSFAAIEGGYSAYVAAAPNGVVKEYAESEEYYDVIEEKRKIKMRDVAAVATSGEHVLVLKKDGTVWSWGDNNAGELGDGTTVNRNSPVQVKGLTDVVAIAAAPNYSMALKRDGTVWTWGSNQYGQLGNGTAATPDDIHFVEMTEEEIQKCDPIWCGSLVEESKELYKEKYGVYPGKLVKAIFIPKPHPLPTQVKGLKNIIFITTNGTSSMALQNDGTLWAWGYNKFGQLGDKTTIDRNIPVKIGLKVKNPLIK